MGGAKFSCPISTARNSTAPTMSASAPMGRSISPILTMDACPAMASSVHGSSASRACTASRRAAEPRNCFSPDEKLLYINDTVQTLIRVFDVAADGWLSNGRMFASGVRSSLEQGVPDGMKCDQRGNVWVTAPGGVWVYAPSGDLLGKVRAPEKVANLAWGGPDFRTLFLTATHSVYRIETKVGARREPYMNARSATSAPAVRSSQSVESRPSSPRPSLAQNLTLNPKRCALIIQDMQNDVIGEGGASSAAGAPAHAREQNVVENTRRLAAAARARGVAVIHVWFVVEPGAPG